jgi:hypothetical protein
MRWGPRRVGGWAGAEVGAAQAAGMLRCVCQQSATVWRNTNLCGGIRGEGLEPCNDNTLCEVLAVLIRQRLP